jgi:hypothetical protein
VTAAALDITGLMQGLGVGLMVAIGGLLIGLPITFFRRAAGL